jgi:hypothetical protein
MKLNRILLFSLFFLLFASPSKASFLLIPMDNVQKNHLKAYGITYWILQNGIEVQWLLNYRGGSFLVQALKDIENECLIRDVSYEIIADARASSILAEIMQPDVNMDAMKLEKAPKIAVYAPPSKLPWDDAVMLVLSYAEIPYEMIYDEEIIRGDLSKYDWLHLHHDDFTGQFGKFWAAYQHTVWYKEDVDKQLATAQKFGFSKVSELKLFVAKTIKDFISRGGFLFAMCAGTDTYDIALAAENVDICDSPFDGDPMDPNAQKKLDFEKTLAFYNFKLSTNPYEYEHSDIDMTQQRKVPKEQDFFTLFEFSAKWDPVPTMLCQNHEYLIKGFMGQTTSFKTELIKPNVLIMGENKSAGEARYIHGTFGQGMWTFYGGHDPEDFQHFVYDPVTDLNLYPNSAGYRLILNNVLFPAAKKKKMKT